MKRIYLLAFLQILACGSLVAQESKKTMDENLLAYVPASVKQFQLYRPAKILRDKDVVEFRSIAGKSFDKATDRLLNQYFKFALADLEDIDTLINAAWLEESEHNGRKSWSHYSIMIIRTENPNEDKFDLATHAVKSETQYKGKTILEMKVALDGQYKYSCILDKKTIVWGRRIEAIQQAIVAGETGPAKSEFFKTWRQRSNDHANFFVKFREGELKNSPAALQDLKGLQWFVGGVDLGKTTQVKLAGKFENTATATSAVDGFEKQMDFLRGALKGQRSRSPEQEVGNKILIGLLNSAKAERSRDRVKAVAKVSLDLEKLMGPLDEFYAASKRSEAANNVRQNTLALHNYESAFGGFPPSVLTHESGKKYSWRIAILPFAEGQHIYDKYDFTQDWDSPHNLEVTSEMPDFFRSDSDDVDSTNTSFFMLTGPGGAFGENESKSFADFRDGTSNTMAIIEAKREVHWAKPEDIVIDPENPLPDFGGFHKGGFNVGMADGSVRFVSEDVAEDILREYFTPSSGEINRPLDVPAEIEESGTDGPGGK